jgi:hypothetical protein
MQRVNGSRASFDFSDGIPAKPSPIRMRYFSIPVVTKDRLGDRGKGFCYRYQLGPEIKSEESSDIFMGIWVGYPRANVHYGVSPYILVQEMKILDVFLVNPIFFEINFSFAECGWSS